jgi:FixJ family two-component response regulator
MKTARAVIHVVDDEPSMRKSLERLFRSAGYRAETFDSAESYLRTERAGLADCLVLDLSMPGLDGVGLQEELSARHSDLAIVFLTGHGDLKSSVRAIKKGAVDFLSKPCDPADLLTAVDEAIRKSTEMRALTAERLEIEQRTRALTPREGEVLRCVISGFLNKQIAVRLGVSEKTIKVHRGKVMEKMTASSVVDLVRLAEKVNILPVR